MTATIKREPTQLESALAMLATPAGATVAQLQDAARVVNDALAAAAAEVVELEARWHRDSLDLMSRGNQDVAQTLSREIAQKKEWLEHGRLAAMEANRRMHVALAQAEAGEELVRWKAVETYMTEREKQTARLVELTNELGKVYGQIAALADTIWDALPRKPHSNPQNIDFFDMAGMEIAVDWSLHYATGWQFGESRLGTHPVPDLVGACRRGHRELLNKKPLEGLRQGLTIDAAEYERRVSKQNTTGG